VRTALLTLVVLACAAAPAQAATAGLMVVGKSGVLRDGKPVTLERETVRVGGRTCRVAAATPLGVLARTSLPLKLRDYGRCGRRTSAAAGLYLRGVGKAVEKGRDGWVYKIGRKAPSTGAGDPASKVRGGARVLWFWCRSGLGGCQRTLEVQPQSEQAAAGSQLRVEVMAYDDLGKGVPAAGATVELGSARAVAGDDGVAVLTVPAGSTTLSAMATRSGLVPAFPVRIAVS
jgi:hypothetical protein